MHYVVFANPTMTGLVVVPGVGRIDRLETVVHNLKRLEAFLLGPQKSWDCVIYVYASYSDVQFWSQKTHFNYISKLCDIVENPGRKVTENLYLVQPALIKSTYKFVFILLDDCKLLSPVKFDLDHILEIMKANQLTVVSPQVPFVLGPGSWVLCDHCALLAILTLS